jgi:hypothetical protein
LIKGFGFSSISVIDVQFADADSLNGNRQKQGAFGGCNGNNTVNIMAARCWRLQNSFCRPNQPSEPV